MPSRALVLSYPERGGMPCRPRYLLGSPSPPQRWWPWIEARAQKEIYPQPQSSQWAVAASALEEMAERSLFTIATIASSQAEIRQYATPIREAFGRASVEYPSISSCPDVMGGAPCINGTRVPVYMVLDAIEHYGQIDVVLQSYPRLTIQQIKDAIGFAKLVVECPVDHETSLAS